MHICLYIYIYIYISMCRFAVMRPISRLRLLDFGGFDSSRILTLRGGILIVSGGQGWENRPKT